MAENEQTATERQFAVQRVYIKDVSFESPNAPDVFRGEWKPQNTLNLNTSINALDDNIYEVVLTVQVSTEMDSKSVFVIEVQQAGIFYVSGFPEEELSAMLGSYCPNLLYPYAREVVTDLVVKGSFPQLILQHVNFDALYAQHQQQVAEQEQGTTH